VRLPLAPEAEVSELAELLELPVPLAPMEVLPLVLGLAAVEPLLVLGLAAVEPLLVLGLAEVEPLLVLVSVLGAALGVLGVCVVEEPVAAPAAGVEVLPEADEPAVPEPEVEPPLPDVWAMDSPPTARAAAAARVVRVFLVVVIANSLNGNPEGSRLKKEAGEASCPQPTFPSELQKVGFCRHSL
jgi:hypothetical protein